MKLEAADLHELRPVIREIVRETLEQFRSESKSVDGRTSRMAHSEPEAAALLGVDRHVLRDARRRGEIKSTKVGGRIAYTPKQLEDYLLSGQR